ncbi:MAG: hypothetical protein ACOYU2_04680 [Nitrospirota bacterium]
MIVPVSDNKIDPRYWAWLKWYDPDLIYSYTTINEELIHKVHRDIQPIIFQGHEIRGEFNGHYSGRPDLEIRPLTSMSILPYLRQRQNIFIPYPRKLLNRFPEWSDDGFIGDNFGTYYGSFGGFPVDVGVRDYLEPLNLAPANASELRYLNPGPIVESEIALLEYMTSDSGAITSVSALSAVNSDYRGIGNHPWSRSFNLVVGDSFVDRISFWNGRLLLEDWQKEHISALRIPKARFENEDFINKLGPYITRWNRISSTGSGPNYITIRSHSVSGEILNGFAEKLQKATNDIVNIEKLKDDTDCCPENTFFRRRYESMDNLFRNQVSEKTALVDFPFPMHLSDTGNIPPRFRTGKWIIEQKIQRHNDFSISNVQHWWRLPRRDGVISLFVDSLQGKVTLEGFLAISVGYDKQKIKITLPEDKDFFKAILHYENHFSSRDLRFRVFNSPAFEFSRLSEKGRYLNGVLGLFRGLNNAFDMISCTYWRNIFTELSDPNRLKDKDIADETEIIKKLKRKLNTDDNKSVAISSAEDWRHIARVVLLQSKKLRKPRNIIYLKKLSSKWCENIERFIVQNPQQINDDEGIIKEWQENLESSLQSLCSSGIFAQGYQWSCKKCGHKNWVSVDRLALTLECNVCRNKTQVPVNFDWSFYLNEFFSASVREHGILPVIWALGTINYQSKDSFFFSPQLDLFTSYPKSKKSKPSEEVDIICISDGKLIIGEVKSSVRDFNDNKLINLAKMLHPDTVLIACFEKNSNEMKTKANNIRTELTSLDCEVVLLEPDEDFEEDDYYLPVLND